MKLWWKANWFRVNERLKYSCTNAALVKSPIIPSSSPLKHGRRTLLLKITYCKQKLNFKRLIKRNPTEESPKNQIEVTKKLRNGRFLILPVSYYTFIVFQRPINSLKYFLFTLSIWNLVKMDNWRVKNGNAIFICFSDMYNGFNNDGDWRYFKLWRYGAHGFRYSSSHRFSVHKVYTGFGYDRVV